MLRSMTGKRAGTLLECMDQIEHFTLRRAWTALGDEELFFEPVPGAWSIRRRDECRTPDPLGAGPVLRPRRLRWGPHDGERVDLAVSGSSPDVRKCLRGGLCAARGLGEAPRGDRAGRRRPAGGDDRVVHLRG